jgi:DNA-binding transcriptional LysR family regulator
MKLQHLRFLAAVIDQGGVVRAAEHLNVTQPTVSAGLRALEHELGQPLFTRGGAGRRLRPTAKAREFHISAVEILRRCEAARVQFRRKEIRRPGLRIGVLRTIASADVAAFTHAIAKSRPDLDVRFREGGPIELREWLRRGRIDAAWTIIDKTRGNTRRLWQEPFVVLAGLTHRFARKRRIILTLSDLEREKLILRASCEMPRGRLWPESLPIRVVARAERDELAFRLVEAGLGVAIAPQSLATNKMVVRSVREMDAMRSIGLIWRDDVAKETLAALMEILSQIGELKD